MDTENIPRLGWIRKRDRELFRIEYITANEPVVGYCLRYSRRKPNGRPAKKRVYQMPLDRFLREFEQLEADHA